MSDLDLDVLNQVVKSIGIDNIFISLGIHTKKKGDKLWFSSPFREDRNPSMCCYLATFYCIDFAGDFKGSIFQLFRDITGKSLFHFFQIDQNFLMDKTFEQSFTNEKRRDSFDNIKKVRVEYSGGKLEPIKDYPEAIAYCEKRGVTQELIDEFNIQYAVNTLINETNFVNRLCIPIYHEGKLISVEGRDVTEKATRKVLYPKRASVSTLFNWENLDLTKPVVMVEGLMDFVKVWLYVTKNVTTPFGIWLTDAQKELINQIPNLVLFPDDDDGGETFIQTLDEFYMYEACVAKIEGKDPGDGTEEEIISAYNNRQTIVSYLLDKYELFPDTTEAESDWGDLL